jgi:hypothetical protein
MKRFAITLAVLLMAAPNAMAQVMDTMHKGQEILSMWDNFWIAFGKFPFIPHLHYAWGAYIASAALIYLLGRLSLKVWHVPLVVVGAWAVASMLSLRWHGYEIEWVGWIMAAIAIGTEVWRFNKAKEKGEIYRPLIVAPPPPPVPAVSTLDQCPQCQAMALSVKFCTECGFERQTTNVVSPPGLPGYPNPTAPAVAQYSWEEALEKSRGLF